MKFPIERLSNQCQEPRLVDRLGHQRRYAGRQDSLTFTFTAWAVSAIIGRLR